MVSISYRDLNIHGYDIVEECRNKINCCMIVVGHILTKRSLPANVEFDYENF